jgi:hypothetical protein
MERRFNVLACSNYPFYKKQLGGGMKIWKHITNSFKHSSFGIWMDLPPPFKTAKKP